MEPVLVVITVFAVVALLLAWSRWLARRRWAAAGHLLAAGVAGLVVAVAQPWTRFLAHFETQLDGQPVANLFFERIAPSRYRVTLTHLPSGRMQVLDLAGDQWRLDLDAAQWANWVAPLGFAARYRIERLAARPAAAAQPAAPDAPADAAGAVRALAAGAGPPPWPASLGARRGDPLLTVHEIQGGWQPMAPGGRFAVRLAGPRAIAVEPVNAPASDALDAR